jgi:hypothetical protein
LEGDVDRLQGDEVWQHHHEPVQEHENQVDGQEVYHIQPASSTPVPQVPPGAAHMSLIGIGLLVLPLAIKKYQKRQTLRKK